MQTVRVDRWNSTNYRVHSRTRSSELVQMIFQKVYSASTKEIQTKWNHSFEFSINALPWSDSFALDYFHSVCITVLIIIDVTDVTLRDAACEYFCL